MTLSGAVQRSSDYASRSINTAGFIFFLTNFSRKGASSRKVDDLLRCSFVSNCTEYKNKE